MRMIALRDKYTNEIDGIFVTKISTARDLQEVINKVVAENESDWTIEDILRNLPSDCEFCSTYDMDSVDY